MRAVPKRKRVTSLSVPDCSCTRPPSAPIIPSPIGRSIAAVAVLEITELSKAPKAAMAPKAMMTP